MIAFRLEDRERVVRGEITVTFRLWRTAKVKAGKTYRTHIGLLEIEDVQVMPAALIRKRDIPLTGCPSIQAIRELAGEHTRTHVGPDTLLHRVQFRYLGDLAANPVEPPTIHVGVLGERLEGMDRRSAVGPWTLSVLRLIEEAPRAPARELASTLGWETLDFKARVRRLKALGLTVSHDVGYELSEYGHRYLAGTTRVSRPPRAGAARSRRTR